jgi:hypothetical protein
VTRELKNYCLQNPGHEPPEMLQESQRHETPRQIGRKQCFIVLADSADSSPKAENKWNLILYTKFKVNPNIFSNKLFLLISFPFIKTKHIFKP